MPPSAELADPIGEAEGDFGPFLPVGQPVPAPFFCQNNRRLSGNVSCTEWLDPSQSAVLVFGTVVAEGKGDANFGGHIVVVDGMFIV